MEAAHWRSSRRLAELGLFLNRLPAGTSNAKFSQFFLQTLAVQTDRRRSARYIPTMAHKLLGQVRDLEFMLRLAKIIFAQADVGAITARLADKHFAGRDLFRQIANADFVAAA